ncbi:5-keto-L-gluconate epimerase [Acetomicrobium mobile]|uniref:5-keto-L-gluconate epimerase n=1 Tax=Acetomicrobium mobile TaxID=97477 RepID=UPI0026F059A3|nr:5-keto-L-gluconate epimerase [Acetomicrobium mobile]
MSVTISGLGSKFAPIILQGNYIEEINKAREIGYKAIELHIRNPKTIDISDIISVIKSNNLTVSTIGTGQAYVDEKICFTSMDEGIRNAAVQRIKDHIDFAALLEAKVIIGTIKGLLPENRNEREIALERVITCLQECADYARNKGVRLVLEAINRYESNYLNTAEQTVEFIEKVSSRAIGLHLDTFHMNIEEKSIAETIRRYSSYLEHLHFADSNRCVPGLGHINFTEILATLLEINYDGYIGIEALPLPDGDSAARQALSYIDALYSRLI